MKSKMQAQIILVYLLVVLLIAGGFWVFISQGVFVKMEEDIIENMQATTEGLTKQVLSYFENSDQIIKNLIFNGTMSDYLVQLNDMNEINDYEALLYDRKFDDLIQNVSSFPIIPNSHVSIYNRDCQYKYQYNLINVSSLEDILDNKVTRDYLIRYNRIISKAAKKDSVKSESTFSIVRIITNLHTDILGYIEVQFNYNILNQICEFAHGRQVYIINQNNQVIYPDDRINSEDMQFLNRIDGEQSGLIRLDKEYYMWEKIEAYDMLVVYKQDESLLFETLNKLKRITVIVLAALILVSLFILYYISYRMLAPIKNLTQQAMQVNYHQMKIDVHTNYFSDEVKVLQESFSDMLLRIRASAEKEIDFLREQEKIKYEVLQKQISPHFIHNTLYVISIAAQEERNQDVLAMCKELSNIMRYSMNMSNMQVRFKEELLYIENYLKLLKPNYGDDFTYIIDVDEMWSEVIVPRMFLQPFIENSFKHGFDYCEPPYELSIVGKCCNDTLVLHLEDNGVCITKEAIRLIKDEVENNNYSQKKDMDSFGVVNTILRIKYLYHDKAQVYIYATKKGTAVSVEIKRVLLNR